MDLSTVVISALVGGLVSAFSSVSIVWITKIYDERRSRREIILKASVESYSQYCENAMKSGMNGRLLPFGDHMLLMTYFADKCLNERVQPENVDTKLAELDEMYRLMHDYRERTARARE